MQQAEEINKAGCVAFKTKRYKDAAKLFNLAIKLNPEISKYYCNRSAAYLLDNYLTLAMEDAETAINLDENNFMAYNRKGAALFSMMQYPEAIKCYKKSISLQEEPTDATQKAFELAELDAQSKEDNPQNPEVVIEEIVQNTTTNPEDETLENFLSDINIITTTVQKQVRTVDDKIISESTPEKILDKLLQKHHSFKNLNPFYVLQLSENCTLEDIRQRYYAFSKMIHPDRCSDIRARDGFEAVQRAAHELQKPERRDEVIKLIKTTKKEVEDSRRKRANLGKLDEDIEPLDYEENKAVMLAFARIEGDKRKAQQNRLAFERMMKYKAISEKKDYEKKEDIQKKLKEEVDARAEGWKNFSKSRIIKIEISGKDKESSRFIEVAKEKRKDTYYFEDENLKYKQNWR